MAGGDGLLPRFRPPQDAPLGAECFLLHKPTPAAPPCSLGTKPTEPPRTDADIPGTRQPTASPAWWLSSQAAGLALDLSLGYRDWVRRHPAPFTLGHRFHRNLGGFPGICQNQQLPGDTERRGGPGRASARSPGVFGVCEVCAVPRPGCEQGGGHPRCLPWKAWRRADVPSWGHTQGTQSLRAVEAQGGSSGLGGSFCLEITCCCGCTLGSPLAQHMLTERLLCAAQRRGCPPDSSHLSHSHPCPCHRSPSLNLSPCSSVTRASLSALCPEHLTPSSLIHLLGSLPPGNVNS